MPDLSETDILNLGLTTSSSLQRLVCRFLKKLALTAENSVRIRHQISRLVLSELHRDHAADKLLTHNIDITEGDGGLDGAIFKFFERKP